MTKASYAMAKRAEGAHQNGLEALPLFYAAVVSDTLPDIRPHEESKTSILWPFVSYLTLWPVFLSLALYAIACCPLCGCRQGHCHLLLEILCSIASRL